VRTIAIIGKIGVGYGCGIWLQLLITAVPLLCLHIATLALLALAAMVVAGIAVSMIGGRHK
jgi:hypothetical protein